MTSSSFGANNVCQASRISIFNTDTNEHVFQMRGIYATKAVTHQNLRNILQRLVTYV